jgi:hypothetical protein
VGQRLKVELIGDEPWSGDFSALGYGSIDATKGWSGDVPEQVGIGLINSGRFRECEVDTRPIPQNTLTLRRKVK